MSFSASILANIKTIEETDEEGDPGVPELLEVLKELPDETNIKEDTTNCVDPLLENVETFLCADFDGEYQEQEYINEYSDDDDVPLRNKRRRTQADYVGRDGCSWSTTKPTDAIVAIESTVQQLQSIGKGPANAVCNALEVWHLLLDEHMLAQIVQHTNNEIKQRRAKSSYQRTTDITELRAWLGLNYLCGIFRNSAHNGPLDELWSLELGNAIFRATMTVKRFEFLMDCLRCCSISVRSKKADYTQVLDIWSKFLINCRSYYAPGGNCVVDTLSLNVTNSSRGLQMLTLCDAKTLYMCNAMFISSTSNLEQDILRLIADFKGTGRNIVLTERHTSAELANRLLESQLTMLGSLPPTAKLIPQEFITAKSTRKLYATSQLNLITNQGSPDFLLASGLPSKINATKLFSLSVNSCQRFQQAANLYSTRNSASTGHASGALQMLHCLLDFAALNAWVLLRLSEKGDVKMQQRDFQRHLGLYLTQQQLKRQLQANSRLTLPQKVQISEVLGEPTKHLLSTAQTQAVHEVATATVPKDQLHVPDGVLLLPKMMEKRGRCRLCPGKNSPKTKTRCQQCLRPLCQKHFIVRCRSCTGVADDDPKELSKEEPMQEDNDDSSS